MAFDKSYYENRKQQLIIKRNNRIIEYSDAAFKYVSDIGEINQEIRQIEEWEAQQPKAEI